MDQAGRFRMYGSVALPGTNSNATTKARTMSKRNPARKRRLRTQALRQSPSLAKSAGSVQLRRR